MTTFKGRSSVKRIMLYLTTMLALPALVSCGGSAGGSNANQNQQTTGKKTASVTISLTGTLPAASAISGAAVTLTLPANVTPELTNGSVTAGVVSNTGTFAGSTLPPQVVYTAATSSSPGTLGVILTASAPGGVTQLGEVAKITLQLANGAAPTAASFGLTGVSVVDAALYGPISGVAANVSNVTLL